VEDGVFDRGGRRDNRVEARRVAQAAIDHARQHPGESLGIGTFSVAQRDAILNELEQLWRSEPDVRSFFASDRREPFFVKNLENIQGDERDVIFISVGYARDADGYFAMNFGPLQNDGGERRLNVLITRAKRRCEVFTSIQSGDIDLNRARSAGAAALREYLAYAEAGSFSAGHATGRGFDSPFEEQVARALEASGFEVVPQVGLAGFYIDLAIVDPNQLGRFLLGIECDGASYHSARSARDRDRLRQQVLESRGWTIHRIWSTDWFNQREDQLRKTVAAIEAARTSTLAATPTESEAPDEAPSWEVETVSEPTANLYAVANFPVPSKTSIHELEPSRLQDVLVKIVEIEGPVCGEVIVRRVTKLWGLKRAGERIQNAVEAALKKAVEKGTICEVGPFEYDVCNRDIVRIRDRSEAPSEVRKSENVPATEIGAGIAQAIEMHVALNADDLARAVARMLGFRSTSSELAAMVVRTAEGMRGVELRDGVYRQDTPPPSNAESSSRAP
jgi:very-short-patch-repair endonuclease